MAEVKRIQLDSVRAPQREKRTKEVTPTFRFNLPLNESTDSACPEYSYGELVKAARAENGENKAQGADPFGDDDDDDEKLQEIARKFEEKYNPKPGKKRKKKPGDWEDYIDKGMGYDETDPFIDNEEAYDELVPSTLTTQFGGFYINTGELEFRNVSETENGLDEKIRKKRRKREILEKEGRKRRKISKDDQMPKRRGRKTANQTESALPKVKKKTQPTVADMLQQHKAQLQLQQQEKLQLSPIPVERHIEPEIVPDAPPPVAPQLPSYPATVAPSSTISDAIESVVKAAGDEASSNGSVGQPTGSSDGEETPAKPPIDNIEAPKLPDNLPPDLDTLVAKLKKAAHNSEEGKCKFFSEDVNKMLLSVELKSQQLTSTQRSTIYSHLASHLPCTKETLQKRAKKLRLDQEDGKLREPMQNLKNAIAEVMPEMLEKYAAALKAAEASREDEKSEAQNSQGTDDDTQGKEDKKAPQAPRKKFEWNESIRKYLCDVVSIKMKCYEVSKTRVQSAEEYLKHFLDTEVRTLWPDGWMKARILFKESQAAHSYITSKQKKPLVVKKSVNNVPPVVVSMKPAVSILNSAVLPAEPDAIEPLSLSDKLVPTQLVTPLTEEVAEKKENSDVSSGVIALNSADKPSDLTKLITFPIKTTADLLLSPKHTEDGSAIQITNSKLLTDVPAKSVASTVNSKPEPVASANAAVQKVIDKIIVTSQVSPTKQSSVTSTKISDMTSAFSESSLASDMLARIICASLGNFPYAGSSAVDGSAEVKPQSVITSSSIIQNLKESRVVSSKLPTSDSVTSPKKFENVKPVNLELKKPSQDVVLQCNSQSIGSISIDALLNAKLTSRSSDIGTTSVLIKKNLPEPTKPAVNLKLKDVIVPQPQQFAEAFERYGTESSPLIRKHSSKISNHHLQNFTLPNASPIRFSNASELPNDKTVSSSTRIALENAQRLSQDLVAKYANPTTSQSLLTAPLKKRSKYSQSTKTSSEQWGPYVDVPHGATSLLEGMKGFPFPVNTLPTPPPAHCSAPHKTTTSQPQDTTFTRLHAPSNSQRTSAHSASVLRVHQDSRGESTQAHPHVLVAEAPRRQSLIQGTWKANPTSQASSTSHSQYLSAGSPLISNPKSTSPNQHSSNTHKIPSPIHAHSHSAPLIEKVSPAHSQNPLPLRVSSSHTPQSVAHPAKTSSPSSIFSQTLSQVQFPAHQSSHPSSTHQEQTPARNNSSFGAAHSPVTTVTSPAGSFPHSQEQSAVHPRTN